MKQFSNPYSPPETTAAALHAANQPAPTTWRRSPALLGLSFAVFLATLGIGAALAWVAFFPWGFTVASVLAFAGFVLGIGSLVGEARGQSRRFVLVGLVFSVLANLAMTGLGALSAFLSTIVFSRGRQIRSFGRLLLPRVHRAESWAMLPLEANVDPDLRSALAARWRENGRTEHASVAAFARLTLDLMALGAPPNLVSAAQRDALDEIRHAELCFSLARAIDGEAQSPAPFAAAQRTRMLPRLRSVALAQLAVDSLIDGALHEGVSARIIAKLAKRCETQPTREILKEIAADEGRHAAHGWEVVEWCLAEGGEAVLHALLGAVRSLPDAMRSPLPEEAASGAWEKYGIHGHALEAEEYAKARADIVRRIETRQRALLARAA